MKICYKCQISKSIEDFGWKNKSKDKRDVWCRDCRREYDRHTRRQRYMKNRLDQIASAHNKRCGGNITGNQLKECLKFFNNKDAYTNIDLDMGNTKVESIRNGLTFDHIIPISRGGLNVIWNIVPTTRQFNGRKHACENWEDLASPECIAKIKQWTDYAKQYIDNN